MVSTVTRQISLTCAVPLSVTLTWTHSASDTLAPNGSTPSSSASPSGFSPRTDRVTVKEAVLAPISITASASGVTM